MLQNTFCQLVQIQHWMKGSENDLERLGSKWSAAVVSTRDVSWRRRGGNRPKLSPPAAAGPPPPPQTHPEKGLAVEILLIACSAGREGGRAPVASAVQQDQSTAINFLQGLLAPLLSEHCSNYCTEDTDLCYGWNSLPIAQPVMNRGPLHRSIELIACKKLLLNSFGNQISSCVSSCCKPSKLPAQMFQL